LMKGIFGQVKYVRMRIDRKRLHTAWVF